MQIQWCIERLEATAAEIKIAKFDTLGLGIELYLWVFGIAHYLDIGS